MSRLSRGRSTIALEPMVSLNAWSCVSMSGAWVVTSTVVSAEACITAFALAASEPDSRMPLTVAVRNPAAVIVALYRPPGSAGTSYSPCWFVVAWWVVRVERSVISTWAFGSNAPPESVTVPRIVPRQLSSKVIVMTLSLTTILGLFGSGGNADGFTVVGPGGGGAMYHGTVNPRDPSEVLVACAMTGSHLSH